MHAVFIKDVAFLIFKIAAAFAFKIAVVMAFTSLPVFAQDLAEPKGNVILTVSGNVAVQNVDMTAQFDLEMLENMEVEQIETSTIWTEGTQTFEGVALSTLVETLGLTGSTLSASAINDYTVEIPMEDAVEGGAMIAYRLNGKEMSVRDKGPLWIVYPFDSDDKFRTEVIYSRSIWQLDRIVASD